MFQTDGFDTSSQEQEFDCLELDIFRIPTWVILLALIIFGVTHSLVSESNRPA